MNKNFGFSAGAVVLLFVLWACNPAKNTAVNRFYHTTTAHYNGYFNANLLLDQSISDFRRNFQEDYYGLIPIQRYPDTGEVRNLIPAIDTAIVKCTKVIQNHSMPGSSAPSKKKEENNNYIDENWITIGRASYIRRDYDAAMKNFQWIKKFYSNDPSNYMGELWMAKTNLAMGKPTEAGFNLDNLTEAIAIEKEANSEKTFKNFIKNVKKSKKKRKQDKEAEPAKIPKDLYPEYYKTQAELNLVRGEKDKAIENLVLAGKEIKRKKDKARVYFVLGQLYEDSENNAEAVKSYTKVIKSNAPFEMAFSARLRRAFLGGSDKLQKDLDKMLRDPKNAEFKDQIYYAMAKIELQKGNEPKAIEYLTSSAFYSTSNSRQKGMAYEKLGDLSFAKRDYIPAQKYYDSCGRVIADTYPNAEGIRNKASKLSELVLAVETVIYEDSVQKIANLSEEDQLAFLKSVSETLKERAAENKKKEAEKLLALQKNESGFNQDQSGNKWYFRNVKTRNQGYEEFKRLWGTRENEDNWRRNNKVQVASFTDENGVELPVDSLKVVKEKSSEPFSISALAEGIPVGDSAINASQVRLMQSLYKAGIIYKDQLNEPELASVQFSAVVEKTYESDFKVMSAYQLYKINEKTNTSKADQQKNYILNYYPNSDYANYLRDPDYFLKKKEYDAKAQKEYVAALGRYSQGLYYPALTKAESVIENEPKNEFRAKYMLLKAMCQGKLNPEKSTLIPVLNQLVAEYPDTEESARANELLSIIKNGYSKFEAADFSNKSIYQFSENVPYYVMVFLPQDENTSLAKSRIVDFNREYFSRDKLKVSSKIFGSDQSIVLVDDFKTDLDARNYMQTFKATRKNLLDLQNAKTILISNENLKTLFETQKLKEYEEFCVEYY